MLSWEEGGGDEAGGGDEEGEEGAVDGILGRARVGKERQLPHSSVIFIRCGHDIYSFVQLFSRLTVSCLGQVPNIHFLFCIMALFCLFHCIVL